MSNHWLCVVPIVISERELTLNLIILHMVDYDMIIGMDFLTKCGAMIDYKAKNVKFLPLGKEQFEFESRNFEGTKMFISTIKARSLLVKGCTGFLANVMDTTMKKKEDFISIPVVCEFAHVFPEDLPGYHLGEK